MGIAVIYKGGDRTSALGRRKYILNFCAQPLFENILRNVYMNNIGNVSREKGNRQ